MAEIRLTKRFCKHCGGLMRLMTLPYGHPFGGQNRWRHHANGAGERCRKMREMRQPTTEGKTNE